MIIMLYFYPDGTGESFRFTWPALHELELKFWPDIVWEEEA